MSWPHPQKIESSVILKSSKSRCLSLGTAEFVMELELTPERKLAREDVNKVLASLIDKGYFIQMPPVKIKAPDKIQ